VNRFLTSLVILVTVTSLLVGCQARSGSSGTPAGSVNANGAGNDNGSTPTNDNGSATNDNAAPSNDNVTDNTVTQPSQPTTGPGSSDYTHQTVRKSQFGSGAEEYWLYEPADPTPESAPVIAFLHGYGATNPQAYGAWISHIVRKGNIVVYPIYQTSLVSPPAEYTPAALAALVDAYDVLRSADHVNPDPVNFALVGHSLGGVIVANLAVEGPAAGLPPARAVMTANASDTQSPGGLAQALPSILTSDYGDIPGDVLWLGVVGADDNFVGDDATVFLLDATSQIPSANKEMITVFSDDHGEPAIRAGHSAPLAPDAEFDSGQSGFADSLDATDAYIDAIDYYGYWKWFEALTDAAFYGTNRKYALGNTPEQTDMGRWSDGTPIRPAEVSPP
jgi:pimeloyl-ACP methyl ester carboxylesterase